MYADYDFYINNFGGNMSAADFAKWERKAGLIIQQVTSGKADDPPATMTERIKLTACALSDVLKIEEAYNKKTQNSRIVSSSVDGWSENYATDTQKADPVPKILKAYLTYPVNLLYSGG